MLGGNVTGLIFTYTFSGGGMIGESNIGALPFGAKYKVIDFTLSNMVNSGIKKVGIITDDNYGQLLEHVGSGEEWNLSHKRQGLFILPPYGSGCNCENSRIKSLHMAGNFLKKLQEEYILLVNCCTVCSMDYKGLFAQHERTGADITLACRFGRVPQNMPEPVTVDVGPDTRVRGMGMYAPPPQGKAYYSAGIMLIRRTLLMQLVADCISRSIYSFNDGLLLRNFSRLKTCAYTLHGFSKSIYSEKDYFEANMSVLNENARSCLFNCGRPVYTKTSDYMPTRYINGCRTVNSLVGDGCLVEGAVENSLLFSRVRVEKGASVKNCIVMPESIIKENCRLNYAIARSANDGSGFSNLEVRHLPMPPMAAVKSIKAAAPVRAGVLAI